jgi:membrane protease YdiL (CAAX protease family)
MRNAAFQRRMTLLAIAAMLLLALLPTAGRLWSAGANASGGAWAQMCTMAGLKLVKIAPAGSSSPAIPGHDGHAGGSDCPYCPLANAIAALVVLVALVPLLPILRSWPRHRTSPQAIRRYPCGLGSRGPPGRVRIRL